MGGGKGGEHGQRGERRLHFEGLVGVALLEVVEKIRIGELLDELMK